MKEFIISILSNNSEKRKSPAFIYVISFAVFVHIIMVASISFDIHNDYLSYLYTIVFFGSLVFLTEWVIRILYCKTISEETSYLKSLLTYLFSFYGVIDLIAIIPIIIVILGDRSPILFSDYEQNTSILLIFKIVRYSSSFKMIVSVFKSVKNELLITLGAASILLATASIIMYNLEKAAQPENFSNIGQGLWWAIVTFTTVGYGDLYPITPLGKFFSGVIAIVGIGMIALPTAIISSSFQVHLKKRGENSTASNNETSNEISKCKCPKCGEEFDK